MAIISSRPSVALVKTRWRKKGAPRSLADRAGVIGANIWKISLEIFRHMEKEEFRFDSDRLVTEVLTEFIAFLVQLVDRAVYRRLSDTDRATLIGETTLGNVEILWGYDFDDGSRAWIAHDTFIPINNQDANWEETGLIPLIQVSAPWDLYTFETDPAIQAALEYFDSN